MITVTQHGKFRQTDLFLERMKGAFKLSKFDKYGRMGVEALREATPKDTGLTSESWRQEAD